MSPNRTTSPWWRSLRGKALAAAAAAEAVTAAIIEPPSFCADCCRITFLPAFFSRAASPKLAAAPEPALPPGPAAPASSFDLRKEEEEEEEEGNPVVWRGASALGGCKPTPMPALPFEVAVVPWTRSPPSAAVSSPAAVKVRDRARPLPADPSVFVVVPVLEEEDGITRREGPPTRCPPR